ncbi:tRNA (adenosine(37)-N6)-threonylcarbamoyltransferase complex dimerization subunit type 1 TsaB [uncultured Rhodoblastus sp.]|uniref:tRNA (adenosine(37)-N6)-threonylcarbamoyltransferase complex dimerization subunit type 1 TsaB n=1 Tax=uncultured Rhodoblastus sp. TaxID=543037 RepID=UPI0025F4C747|nr:tRNA (adenosine(37)-N6)-threonylcarbamoyltransferase complex dimerization subunit type 1 TsaB [uncultured Rhodoblastus sp.]
MRILALDTALPAVSLCILDSGALEPLALESIPMERGHAEALMPMVARAMAKVDGGFASLERIAVTVGPGSFTGIRIGIAAARGMALALGIETVGVSTLAAFAAPLLFEEAESIVVSAIDARHGHVFFTAYGPGGRVLTSPRILLLRDACRLLGAGRVRAVGSGAWLLKEEALKIGCEINVVNAGPAPDIVAVARLGLAADPANAPARPLYLKAPDVKPSAIPSLPRVPS